MSYRRAMVVVPAAVLLAGLVLREAIVMSSLAAHPERAASVWPGHPEAVFAERMMAIGEAAKAHRPIDAALTAPVIDAARRAPLAPEPFLVRGVALQGAGDEAGAGLAFLAARNRDPRSVAAHFFLADHYGRTRQAALALTELARLIKLVPGSSTQLAPRIAASLKVAGGVNAIRLLVADNPQLRDDLLQALATDAGNAGLIASLAPDGRGPWVPSLVGQLVAEGQYHRAFELWRHGGLGKPPPRGLLIDPSFTLADQPPFGWTLAGGVSGVAEPAGGGLHIVYYGRDRLVAASQLLLLPPGNYVLSYDARSAAGDLASLQWQLTCDKASQPFVSVGLGDWRPSASAHAVFAVLADCPAQRLDLIGAPADPSVTLDATMTNLELRRAQ
ncbi:MAG: hypothetical protein ABR588_01980 [Sphingomicrobium sp.]|nr:hypothetical protein [Sphingomonadales bacterium]